MNSFWLELVLSSFCDFSSHFCPAPSFSFLMSLSPVKLLIS